MNKICLKNPIFKKNTNYFLMEKLYISILSIYRCFRLRSLAFKYKKYMNFYYHFIIKNEFSIEASFRARKLSRLSKSMV